MNSIDLCDCHKQLGCTLSATCRRAIEEPEENQQYVTPDYYANSCRRYYEVETLADRREALRAEAAERYHEMTS